MAGAQPITGYFPGWEDWFWGGAAGSVGNITNSVAVTGDNTSRTYIGDLDTATIQNWIDHPEQNYGLAVIALPAAHYGSAMFATSNYYIGSSGVTVPTITVNGDTALTMTPVAGAWISRQWSEGNVDTAAGTPDRLTPGNGPHTVMWKFDTSKIAPGTVVSSASFKAVTIWAEGNRPFDVYKVPKAWDPATVSYAGWVDTQKWSGGDGDWDTNAWGGLQATYPTAPTFPNGGRAGATFPQYSAPVNVTVGHTLTMGYLRFENSNGTTITGTKTMDTTGVAKLLVSASAGTSNINVPVFSDNGMVAIIDSGAQVNFNNWLSNNVFTRRSLEKYGAGTLLIGSSNKSRGASYAGSGITVGTRASVASGGVTTWSYTEGGTLAFGDGGAIDINGTFTMTPDAAVAGKYHGQVDIGKGAMIMRSGGTDTAAAHATKLANLNKWTKAGLEDVQAGGVKLYDGLGGGIWSRTAVARNQIDGAYGVGLMDNNDGSGAAIYTTFAGVGTDTTNLPVNADCILLKLTYNGDTDLNGVINTDDYFGMLSGMTGGGTGWTYGDFDYSGAVNSDDYFMFLTGKNAFQNEGAITWSPVSVPEPASLSLLGLSAAGLLARRRK